MTESDYVLRDVEDGVATLTLNRPDTLNAFSAALQDELISHLRDLNRGDAVRVIRLRGSGRAFCAGTDIGEAYNKYEHQPEAWGVHAWELGESRAILDHEWLREMSEKLMWIWSYRKPIVAQVHGFSLGMGLDLMGASDLIYMAEDCRTGHPATRAHGIPPTLAQWPFRIGMQKTKELLFTGELIDGVEAARIGMVNRALPLEQLDDHVAEVCRRIAKVPLDALVMAKHATNRWFESAGLRNAVASVAEFDSLAHTNPAFDRFVGIARTDGVKAAVRWRDAPFRSNGASGKTDGSAS